ncbi:M18 family aminopeptidase [Pelomyxa schiedti]|nr:M18 family aminopeptidase [Pelomyxa schiedti]
MDKNSMYFVATDFACALSTEFHADLMSRVSVFSIAPKPLPQSSVTLQRYQWVQTPLALVGVVALKSGEVKEISVGLKPEDPVFVIPDLLPHLATRLQSTATMGDIIKGEQMNVLCGSIPVDDEGVKAKIKFTVLETLNREYGVTEADFLSAELELVPAFPPRFVGFDCGLIASYGQDDRICAFSNISAITTLTSIPSRTAVAFLVDKEEVGNQGSTGMDSMTLYHLLSKLVYLTDNTGRTTELRVREILSRSSALSTDVTAGVDPNFREVHEMKNAAKLGFGPCFMKYAGARGKSGTNDADAEYIAMLRALFDTHNVSWQMAELGRVDEGGGGTIAPRLASYMINTIDLGPPLIGMHAPYELSSVADLYLMVKGCSVFLQHFNP